jgi:hypothetical protein
MKVDSALNSATYDRIPPAIQQKLEEGRVLYIEGATVKREFQDKKLFTPISGLIVELGRRHHFQYGLAHAMSLKGRITLERAGFQIVSRFDCR